jgi:hypothetical protein
MWLQSLAVGVTVLLAVGAVASVKKPISIVVQSVADSSSLVYRVVVKVSITNNSRQQVWFATCPEPYTVELTDSNGQHLPYKHPRQYDYDEAACGANGIITIGPNKTWATEIALDEMFSLKAEPYYVHLLWRFPWNVRKTEQGSDFDTLTGSSNNISLTVTP